MASPHTANRVRHLPLLTNGDSPFRGHDDEWTPPCAEQDSRTWTNPRDRADVRHAATVCHEQCERRLDCFAAGRSRGEYGVWGGSLMVAGQAVSKFHSALWNEDRHTTAEEREAAEHDAARARLRDMLAPHLAHIDPADLAERNLPTWLETAAPA